MKPEIIILLSIYKEASYLKELLDSLVQQSFRNFIVLCRFDGGSEYNQKNKALLKQYPFVHLLPDEAWKGVTGSYELLLKSAESSIPYIMFADQDDVWHPDKTEQTLAMMKQTETEFPGQPVLCHSDLRVVTDNLQVISESFEQYQSLNCGKKEFRHLMIQNNITGCTVMINRPLADIASFPDGAVCHDWYLGLTASAFGKIAYSRTALIDYRQHQNNCYGAVPRKKLLAGFFARKHLQERVKTTQIQAETFLRQYGQKLSPQQREMLSAWSGLLAENSYLKRLLTAWKYRFVKNDLLRTFGLWWSL